MCLLLACPAAAQETTKIPEAVIDGCLTSDDASRLPGCLKEGAFGHQMLEVAVSSEYFGGEARPVAEACIRANENFQAAWTCFDKAARAAVETRALIGIDMWKSMQN